ncbi:hypothetical protein PRIPAC_97580 [Pristionchus pacificus]|uniref:Uncharacterized protein n=1 Tax=Pristionchus pacificus TaxID=54126 RepID=A0A2A6BCK8_PRIPA|nr:hypothetical protein PRIPAC_97580 [Pristionchus pacificus]|eukprot:PDM63613.1 hypothetical protein PRIPAC_49586 [Pristionchus pacificus]
MNLYLLFFISFLLVIPSGDTYRFFNATAVEEALKHVVVRITGIRIICEALYCHFNASDVACKKACAENSSKFKKVTLPTENADEDIETCWNGCKADCREGVMCDNECTVLCGTHWNSTNRKEYEEEYLQWANETGRF